MQDQVVLITGGTSGIGLALADASDQRRARVIVCARSDDGIARFSSAYPKALAIKADVTVAADRRAMLDAVARKYGRLDILINNAGVFTERDFTHGPAPLDGLHQEMSLNLLAPMWLTAEALERWPAMKAIVFVTSGFALVSPTRAPTYGAAKAGLHGFAEGLRRQLASQGTHVLELLPPTVDTPMNAGRQVSKMAPADVAKATLDALDKRRPQALPGPARLLPILLRIAPGTTKRMVSAT